MRRTVGRGRAAPSESTVRQRRSTAVIWGPASRRCWTDSSLASTKPHQYGELRYRRMVDRHGPSGFPRLKTRFFSERFRWSWKPSTSRTFWDCSWGFRPGRSAHGALKALRRGLMEMGGGWLLDVDIERFFDSLDHKQLRGFLDLRVRDGVLRRTIHKWLKAGVLDEGPVVSAGPRHTARRCHFAAAG